MQFSSLRGMISDLKSGTNDYKSTTPFCQYLLSIPSIFSNLRGSCDEFIENLLGTLIECKKQEFVSNKRELTKLEKKWYLELLEHCINKKKEPEFVVNLLNNASICAGLNENQRLRFWLVKFIFESKNTQAAEILLKSTVVLLVTSTVNYRL